MGHPKVVALLLALLLPCQPQIPRDFGSRYAQEIEKLEVLVLHVLECVRRYTVRAEQPLQITRATTVEAECLPWPHRPTVSRLARIANSPG